MFDNLSNYQIILASKSPRCQQLLAELGIHFKVKTFDTDESFPADLPVVDVPVFLAKQKAKPFENTISGTDLIITSDTIVAIQNEILGKPANYAEAFEMLEKLSGKLHQVITGVLLYSTQKSVAFTVITNVWFKQLSDQEIDYYITNFKPFDKAGAYGIQEWIGHIGVERIEGSYFNVMGLPVQKLYEILKTY